MNRTALYGAHAVAVAALIAGLWLWDAEGAEIWRDAIFSFCT